MFARVSQAIAQRVTQRRGRVQARRSDGRLVRGSDDLPSLEQKQ
jgi:hypothetical protein